MERWELLAAARSELRRMAEEYRSSAFQADEAGEARTAAYCEAACDSAEDAIFGVLNVVSNYADDDGAREFLHATGVELPA